MEQCTCNLLQVSEICSGTELAADQLLLCDVLRSCAASHDRIKTGSRSSAFVLLGAP
jgi:hypothetical protein